MTVDTIGHARRLIERFNAADLDGVLSCYADDVDYFEVGGRRHRGRKELRPYLERYFAVWNNRWRITRVHRLVDAENEVVMFWDVALRRQGEDHAREASGMELLTFRGEQIEADWLYFDTGQLR